MSNLNNNNINKINNINDIKYMNNFYIINYINIDNYINKYNNNHNMTTKLDWCNKVSLIIQGTLGATYIYI